MNRQQYIDAHRQQFWYTPEAEKQNISDSLLVETMLNYGTLDDFRELMAVLTPKRVAEVFFSATERQVKNYYPEVRHFFSLVLKKYAPSFEDVDYTEEVEFLIENPPTELQIKDKLTDLATTF